MVRGWQLRNARGALLSLNEAIDDADDAADDDDNDGDDEEEGDY